MGNADPRPSTQIHLLQINASDNVAVAVTSLQAGYEENIGGVDLKVLEDVKLGAKLALQPLKPGDKIIKFGEPIGSASQEIQLGEYVHTHNLQSDYIATVSQRN